jgi:hypothetical protein
MNACMQQGSLAPRALPRFLATTSPSDSHPDAVDGYAFPSPTVAPSDGLSGSPRVTWWFFWHAPTPFTPIGPTSAQVRCFPDGGRLRPFWEVGRRYWFNEAETSSPLAGFGLTPSSSGRTTPFAWTFPDRIASRASLLSPADAQLDVERTIFIIDTFQPIRTPSHCWCNQKQTKETKKEPRPSSSPLESGLLANVIC